MPGKQVDPTMDRKAAIEDFARMFGTPPSIEEQKAAAFEAVQAKTNTRPTVCVDLDGCLNLYDGWQGADHYADPRPGAQAFCEALMGRYRVVILTTRDPHDVQDWLARHGFPLGLQVTPTKPPAIVYIDDRAIRFDDSFDGLLDQVATFRAHWEMEGD